MYRYGKTHPSVRYRYHHGTRDIIAWLVAQSAVWMIIAMVLIVIVPYVLDLLGIYLIDDLLVFNR